MPFFRKRKTEQSQDQRLTNWLDSGGTEELFAGLRSQIYDVVPARTVDHGTYDLATMQRHIDFLKTDARLLKVRGRDVSGFWELISQAEAYLQRGSHFSSEAHRYGYSAMHSLVGARFGQLGGSALYRLTPARNYAGWPQQCERCGSFNADLKLCDDFLCTSCFAGEVGGMLVTEAYWIAPNDEAYVPLDYYEARERAYADAERVLSEQ